MKNEPLCHAPCPIARSLGRIGDSWSIMILRDAFAGFTRFDEFQKSSNVAPNILSR
ncbi:TPA: helix-turn-helix transcriptional regulator, partial [Klebsiella pneumoniae]|nr:helix-turn-helix transcriptional regulator [Klebsiella pneumoniae]